MFFVTVCCQTRAVNHLVNPAIAKAILESAQHRHNLGQWWVHLILVMPDHWHALVTPSRDTNLAKVIADLKRYLSRRYPTDWQRDFFDHRIRSDESLEEKWDYILANPVRAGHVQRSDDWPWLWWPEKDESVDDR